MQYVYRYIGNGKKVLYIGITSDMKQRVNQHKKDKLKDLKNATIQYFPVKSRTDAEIIETYLISTTKSCHDYNVSKTAKDKGSLLDEIDFPWMLYEGHVDKDAKPFVIPKTEIVHDEKYIYIPRDRQSKVIEEFTKDYKQSFLWFEKEIHFEREQARFLFYYHVLTRGSYWVELHGAYLHSTKWWRLKKAYRLLQQFFRSYNNDDRSISKTRYEFEQAMYDCIDLEKEIREFEKPLLKKEKR